MGTPILIGFLQPTSQLIPTKPGSVCEETEGRGSRKKEKGKEEGRKEGRKERILVGLVTAEPQRELPFISYFVS